MLVFVPMLLIVERMVARRIFAKHAPGRARSAGRSSSSAPTPTPSACSTLRSARPTSATGSSGSSAPTTSASVAASTCSAAIDDDRGGARGDRRHRRADLAVVGRVGARQPAHPRADRRRLPRRPVVGPPRHRRRPLPGPGPRRAHARSTSSRSSAAGGAPSPSGSSTSPSRSSRWCSRRRSCSSRRIAIKRSSPGPVIFAQERVGRDGVPFRVFKLRTMVADADARKAELAEHNEADGPMFKMANDPRVTRVGALLRKLSIDEIPQFVNVLRGEMSVVGPRPALAVRGRAVDRRRPRAAPGAARHHRACGRCRDARTRRSRSTSASTSTTSTTGRWPTICGSCCARSPPWSPAAALADAANARAVRRRDDVACDRRTGGRDGGMAGSIAAR